MSLPINNDDTISRVVCLNNKKNYCRVSDGSVKPKAFKPNAQGDTSVFVTTRMSQTEIIDLGVLHICETVNNVYGYANLAVEEINKFSILNIDYNNEPAFHANLKNWPEDKGAVQDILHVLAAKAICVKN